MRTTWLKPALLAGFSAIILTGLPALVQAQQYPAPQYGPGMGTPGVVNYIEGQVAVNGSDLNRRRDNTPAVLQPGQVLTTRDGKAEILLSPGVFLRVGRNSEIRMVSPEMADPRFELTHGEAMVEVDQKLKDGARVDAIMRGTGGTILKAGLYRFDSDKGLMEVLDGKLAVMENGRSKEIGKGKEFMVSGGPVPQVARFDRKAEDEVYAWSQMRSGYMAEVNASTARQVYGGYGPFAGNGWYWDPYFASWGWLPGDGYFYSPFGYPFFSPGYIVYAPYYRGFRGWGGHGGYSGGAAIARGGFSTGHAAMMGGGVHGGGGGGRR